MSLVYFVRSLLYQSTLAFSYVARRLPIKKLQCIHTTKRLCITMDSVYELVGLWMTIQTLAWHLNSLDGIGIVADAKVLILYSSQSIAKANMTRIWLKRSFENNKEIKILKSIDRNPMIVFKFKIDFISVTRYDYALFFCQWKLKNTWSGQRKKYAKYALQEMKTVLVWNFNLKIARY